MPAAELPTRLTAILSCPACAGDLHRDADELKCAKCDRCYRIEHGVPVFLAEPAELALSHASNAIGAQFAEALQKGDDFILHIGAGGSPERFPNCVEFEHKIFRHTDVVGDAHQLPFRDSVFDRVFALNVFEHLIDPKRAATEIFRVLKPGGTVAIHTAFLQSLHEEPHHYYNATEFGVREWFAGFEINAITVTGNFGPGVMLGFLMSNVLEAARRGGASWREQMRLSDTTIGEWAEFWGGKGPQPPGFETLQSLPAEDQKRIAAGFEMVATKPATA
jgi:SAM-dependent methyltransferase